MIGPMHGKRRNCPLSPRTQPSISHLSLHFRCGVLGERERVRGHTDPSTSHSNLTLDVGDLLGTSSLIPWVRGTWAGRGDESCVRFTNCDIPHASVNNWTTKDFIAVFFSVVPFFVLLTPVQ